MDAMEELCQLSESMMQAAALLADEDVEEASTKRTSTFLNVVVLGNVGAGKSAVLNSLIGHPVLPTGENGATRAPICIDLQRDASLSSKSIILQIDNKSQQVSASALRHSLQDRLSKGAGVHSSGKSRSDEIYLKLRTSTAPPLKLIDLPGLDQRAMDESMVSDYAACDDAILLVIVSAAQASEISSSQALKLAKEFDSEGTRTIGVISKIDQEFGEKTSLAAVQALLSNQGPRLASNISWVALVGQSVSIVSVQAGSVGSDNSLETAWRAESENLKSILTGAPTSKLGKGSLVETLAKQIHKRMKARLPNLLSGLQGKSQMVEDELISFGEQMDTSEDTRAIALEICRESEDKFLQHISSGEGSSRKIVEGNIPNLIKQLPLDRHFDINNVKKVFLFLLWGIVFLKVDGADLQNDVKGCHPNIVIELPCSQKYLTGYFYEKHGQILESDFHGLAQEVGSDELSRSLVHSLNDVFGFSVLNRYLIGEGSHRRLVTNFKLNIKPDDMSWLNNHYCEVVVIERLPIGVFVDPFELQHLVEHRVFLDVAVFGDTNLELPSALSNKSVVEVHMNTTHNVLLRQHEITVELPLHARYPPLDVAGYSKIEFDQPDLLMRCEPRVTQLDFCSWTLASWSDDTHKDGIFWLVPCGNEEHTALVSSITFISALVSALLIVISVIYRSTNEDMKRS